MIGCYSLHSRKNIGFYDEKYRPVVHFDFRPSSSQKKIRLGTNRTSCRFCSRTSASTTFRQKAHTVPEFLGNKWLLSKDECDGCNEKFSRTLDEHLARFLGVRRTLFQLPGKKGVPAYSVPGRKPQLRLIGPNKFEATNVQHDEFIHFDPSTNKGKLLAYKQPYIPRCVFRCLTKIAIAIMPDEELKHFEDTIHWINNPDPAAETLDLSLKCYKSTSYGKKHGGLSLLLFLRRNPDDRLPYASFVLGFRSLTFQIFVPFSGADQHLHETSMKIPPLPNRAEALTEVRYEALDLSSNLQMKDEVEEIEFEALVPPRVTQIVDGVTMEVSDCPKLPLK